MGALSGRDSDALATLLMQTHPAEPRLTIARNMPNLGEVDYGQAREQATRPQEEEGQSRQAPQRLSSPSTRRRGLTGHPDHTPMTGPLPGQFIRVAAPASVIRFWIRTYDATSDDADAASPGLARVA